MTSAPLVLVADDDADLRSLVVLRLQQDGYRVVSASDGEQALQLARELDPDVLLLDVAMPRLDGYTVCRVLASERAVPAPVVFLTGADSTESRITGLDSGAVDYVVKPFVLKELLARVRAALRTKRLLDGLASRPAPAAAPTRRAKVLVVDDDADIRRLLQTRLASTYDVVFASDAIGAVQEARVQRPDLVLLDLNLPGGSGLVVMQRLQSIGALQTVPVIVVSAHDGPETERSALAAGAHAFVAKPFDHPRLLAEIQSALA
jgi:DNA-binding response OmpR family regulator